MEQCLLAENLSSGYGNRMVVNDVDLSLPMNKISVIIGAEWLWKIDFIKNFKQAGHSVKRGGIFK